MWYMLARATPEVSVASTDARALRTIAACTRPRPQPGLVATIGCHMPDAPRLGLSSLLDLLLLEICHLHRQPHASHPPPWR